jgi:hypothetical protein
MMIVLLGHKRHFDVELFVGSRLSAPGPQEKRFAAYIEVLANAASTKTGTHLKELLHGIAVAG